MKQLESMKKEYKSNHRRKQEQERAHRNVNMLETAAEALLVPLLVSCGAIPVCKDSDSNKQTGATDRELAWKQKQRLLSWPLYGKT